MVAEELRNLPNNLSIEGHTDSKPYAQEGTYSNWELSVDRANSARRNMQEMGIRQNQVSQVRGYADQRLRVMKNPLDPSNRRISLIVQYANTDPPVRAALHDARQSRPRNALRRPTNQLRQDERGLKRGPFKPSFGWIGIALVRPVRHALLPESMGPC